MKKPSLAFGLVLVFALVLTLGPMVPAAQATTSSFTAASVHVLQGSTVSGTYASTQTDNGVYHEVAAAWGGGTKDHFLELYYELGPFSITDESWITQIDTRWQAKQPGTDVNPTLYWRDFDASAWVSMGLAAFGETDTNIDDQQTTNLARFRNSTGYFNIRAYATCSYFFEVANLYTDYLYVTFTWAEPAYAPVNLQASCKNLDNTDNLYARYKAYTFTSNTSDANGYANLNYIDLFLMAGASIRFQVRFTEGNNSFFEVAGADITLNTASCSYVKSGNWVNLTWSVTIEWTHPEDANDDLKLGAMDDGGLSDLDTYDVNYDIGTTLDGTVLVHDAYNADDRGSLNGVLHLHVSPWYYIEPTAHPNPPVAEVDFWVSCANVSTSPWSQTGPTSYPVEVVCAADDEVGLDWFSLKIVANGAGYSGTDLLHASGHQDSYISDRVSVVLSITYSHIQPGANCSGLLKSGTFQYDSAVFDGTITLNSTTFSYATACSHGFTATSVSGGSYGVTSLTSNSLTVYWENVTCTWSQFWTSYSDSLVFSHITVSVLKWTSGTNVPDGAYVAFYENGTLIANVTTASQQASIVRAYGASWADQVALWTVKLHYQGGAFNISSVQFYQASDAVPIVHTLYINVWSQAWTDLYLYLALETNWHNATLTIWDNTTLADYFSSEGTVQLTLSTTAGLHILVLLVNGSSPKAPGTYDASFTDSDSWDWRFINYTVSLTATTMHINLYMADGSPIFYPWGFKVYIDGHRLDQTTYTTTQATVNLTITDLWNATVYQDLTATVADFVDIVTNSYYLIFTNQRTYSVNCSLEFNSRNFTIPEGLGPGEGFTYRLYTGNYTLYCWRTDTGEPEPGFPKTRSVVGTWTVYTEKDKPANPDNPGGGTWTILQTGWWAALIAVVGLGAYIVYEKKYQKRKRAKPEGI